MRILYLVICLCFASIVSAQNVGIGQAAPKAKLDINGNLIIGSAYSGSGTVTVPSNGAIIQGNVGIGNSNPGALLDLGLAGTTAGVLRLAGSTSGNITIQTQAAAGTYILTLPSSIGSANQVLANGSTAGSLTWVTPSAGTVTSVSGSSPITVSNGGLGLNTSSSSGYPYVASGTWSVITAATLASNIGALTTANVSGSTNYVAKFTGTNTIGNGIMYDNGSNVGIGTTSPGFLLDVETSAVTQAKFGSGLPVYIIANSPMVGFNTYWNGGYTYGTSGAAGILTFSQEVYGGFSFNTASSGSSGSSAAMTSRLAITNSGYVGVGTTSPAGVLDVTSTTSGFLPPRMTDAQRLAISSPVSGMEIYNTTSGCLNYYSSGNWYGVCGTSLLPSQCTSFTVLNDNTRATSYSGGSGCDNSLASGWYRVEGSYSQIPTSAPSPNECNTQATGWLNISIPSVGATNSGSACWSWTSSTCQWSTSGCQITNCNGYYVYYLNPVTWGCNGRYCVQ